VAQALKVANVKLSDVSAIAFTRGPGLLGSLLVGTSFAKGLALAYSIPLVEINHLQGHVLAHFIHDTPETTPEGSDPNFPFLTLLVSGGHTQIIKVSDHFEMQILGETTDDAAGEAFDKCAKVMGLGYPGGPQVDAHAQIGNPLAFQFSKPRIDGLGFSFSGLKTSFLYTVRDQLKLNPNFIAENLDDLCASLQHTIVSILIEKLKLAVAQTGITEIAIGGGVAANSGLRNAIQVLANKNGWRVHIPARKFTTDNAAMIAIAGYYKFLKGEFVGLDVSPLARMPIV
jgi:N6-L-threonylcarbamoyladenine synthase